MPCPRCKNPKYPEEFVEVERKDNSKVNCCKECNYPKLTQTMRERLAGKLNQVKPLAALPKGAKLKKVDPKYFGETLDPGKRPLEELEELRNTWLRQWDENYEKAGNFYDWVGTQKGGARVLQLTAEERLEYVVTIKGGFLTGHHIDTKHSEYAFVLDGHGNFYAAPKETAGEIRIHHSTFLSGAPVQCAGVFFCTGKADQYTKKITYVKDYSGHYQPGIPEILRLKKRLVDLGEGDITLWYYGPPSGPGALPAAKKPWKGPIEIFTGYGPNLMDMRLSAFGKDIQHRIETKKAQHQTKPVTEPPK